MGAIVPLLAYDCKHHMVPCTTISIENVKNINQWFKIAIAHCRRRKRGVKSL